jgi:hypothetical protein
MDDHEAAGFGQSGAARTEIPLVRLALAVLGLAVAGGGCVAPGGGRALVAPKPADVTGGAAPGGDPGGAGGASDGAADPGDSGGGAVPDTGEGGPAAPSLRFRSPADGATVENPVTFVIDGEGVDRVELSADGWALGAGALTAGTWETTYTFSGTGYPRSVLAEGFDAAGARVATAGLEITVAADPSGGVALDVPYFYQYDNLYEPGATCGLTSAAMVLGWWTGAGAPSPDELYTTYGKAQGQSPSGLAALYRYEGLHGESTVSGSRADIVAHLDAGRPVVVHGDWTGAGHIAVIIGYDDADWIVNDPAGDWEVCYGCGGGDGVRYARGGAWDAAMSWDGDVWLSVADVAPL